MFLVTRGHDAAGGKPEEPGALKVFDFRDGMLSNEVSVAPDGGYGFGPRHLDFHPTKPWVYVSLERQNRLDMFALDDSGLSSDAAFPQGRAGRPGQHPRASGCRHGACASERPHSSMSPTAPARRSNSPAERVFAGGENSLAVFAIDPATGEPTPIQHVDTRGIHPRTFHIDPSGRLLVVAHIMGLKVRDGDAIREVPAWLSLFRIAADGRLDFARTYDIDVGERTMWWMGMMDLAG